jgi:hypothetical protein
MPNDPTLWHELVYAWKMTSKARRAFYIFQIVFSLSACALAFYVHATGG